MTKKKQVEEFAKQINASWQKAVESIILTGQLLNKAKEAVGHGRFTSMVNHDLPFGSRTAQMLMTIADHPVIGNPKFIAVLPPSWGTLYDLCHIAVRPQPCIRLPTAAPQQRGP